MSLKERKRLDAMQRIERQELTLVSAAALVGLSVRQMRRVWKRYASAGDAGLVHRLRDRASNHRLDEATAAVIVRLHQEQYHDYGPTLACEKLAEKHGQKISPNTLTRLLKERGLWQRRRKRGRHRQRRERRSSFGSMIQMDGSIHAWFEDRAEQCVLMVLVDDATGQTFARFCRAETSEAAFDAFGRWVRKHGLPRSLYVDKDSIYRNAEKPQQPTQFGRAMKDLGVELICAHSPQAKGRVERRNGVLQDRLVKELRERRISDMQQANALLEGGYLDEFNRRFAIKAASSEDLHRPVPAEVVLEEVLCEQEERVVGHDWCVRWKNRFLQIDRSHAELMLPRRRVRVKQLGDGRLLVEHQGKRLVTTEVKERQRAAKQKKPIVNNRRWKPQAGHPWNRGRPGRQPSPPRIAPVAAAAKPPASAARGSPAPAAPARDCPGRRMRKESDSST